MARPIRRFGKEKTWDIGSRTRNEEFRLSPTPERCEAILYCLAWAQEVIGGIEIFAFCCLSDHFHLIARDAFGWLSFFMGHLIGNIAKAINAIDGVRGSVFAGRFTAIEILDRDAAIDRIAYTVANPAQAGLVDAFEQWQGICLFAPDLEQKIRVSKLNKRAYRRALRKQRKDGTPVRREDFLKWRTLTISPYPGAEKGEVLNAVRNRESDARMKRTGRRALGFGAVVKQSPFARPISTKRAPKPKCHTFIPGLWTAYMEEYRVFEKDYRIASIAYRAGVVDTQFPQDSFRPWLPPANLLRPRALSG